MTPHGNLASMLYLLNAFWGLHLLHPTHTWFIWWCMSTWKAQRLTPLRRFRNELPALWMSKDLVFIKHTGSHIGYIWKWFASSVWAFKWITSQHWLLLASGICLLQKLRLCSFSVKGLFINLQFPYAQLACKSLSGDHIFNLTRKLCVAYRIHYGSQSAIIATIAALPMFYLCYQLSTEQWIYLLRLDGSSISSLTFFTSWRTSKMALLARNMEQLLFCIV